jgi:hypothetical protein
MSMALATPNQLRASASRSGFTLIQLPWWLFLLGAALLLLAYLLYREQVNYWFREQFASKAIESEESDAASIRAVLDTVQLTPPPPAANAAAAQSRVFLLSARYVDKDGNVLVGPASMQWGFDPVADGSAKPSSGEITVSSFPNTGSVLGKATVSGGTAMTDAVSVKRWANPQSTAAEGDVVKVQETRPPGVGPPSVVLVEEASELGCAWGRPRAFIGAAAVGEQELNPCSLSLLSARDAMVFQENKGGNQWPPGTWAANGATVSVSQAPPPKVDLTIFIAPPDNSGAGLGGPQAPTPSAGSLSVDPVQLAKNDVDMAKALYQANRTGVEINVKGYHKLPYSTDLLQRLGADPYDCIRPVKLPANPARNDFSYDSAAVSVYYVSTIAFPTDPAFPRVRGIQCHFWYSGNPSVGNPAAVNNPAVGRPPGNGPVVYISYGHHSPVTLAHELGHALGLKDEEGKLGPVDIMHNLLPDGDLGANARSDLTVGQVFRMNVWNDSYLNTRLPQPPQRACDDVHPCPPAELDAH